MYTKVPHCCGNNFGGGGDTLGDESSDYDEVLEFQSEGDANESSANGDFSEFLWMENEELFEENVFQSLEEQELINECIEAMNELVLLDEIKQVEAEQITESNNHLCDVAERSSLNPLAQEFVPIAVVTPN